METHPDAVDFVVGVGHAVCALTMVFSHVYLLATRVLGADVSHSLVLNTPDDRRCRRRHENELGLVLLMLCDTAHINSEFMYGCQNHQQTRR